ncbi:two-component system response regulator BaeR [Thiocapsa imhoffii]|uniref:Two-component system response regulator BaeR n=1 Tax=Thiocapsa imhoffii TaxID=382777 RepID=A0A9X1B8F4_9GAMM|nr:response regulator [Thiocapsa imhoffii]MBK1644702.1 two-component system response regulator BaeR [Thiocapsa imhoffii]
MPTPVILMIEDEDHLAAVVGDYLRAAGYQFHHLATGTGAVDWIRQNDPDLILLDLMLPGQDGLSICREVRLRSPVPIMMTTARVEEIDRLLGLELGADDYLCKPYSPRELVARVKAVLRRTQPPDLVRAPGLLQLAADRLQVCCGEQVIILTAVEFALLTALHQAAGRILSRQHLMNLIYADNRIVSDRTIDSHVKKLRRRLAELVPNTELIHSVYGVGYRYEEPDQPS